jgi:signal peptidase II
MTRRRVRLALLSLVLLGVVGCDQSSKEWAERELPGEPRDVAGPVELRYAQNHGMAFSLERVLPAAAQKPLVILGGLLILGVIAVTWYRRRGELSAETAGYALVIGGAIGNLLDRAARGYVVDFVHIDGWPIFNVADVAIAAGVALLLAARIRQSRAEDGA